VRARNVLISEKQLCPFAWINGNCRRSRHGQILLVAVVAYSVEVTCGIAYHDPFERCNCWNVPFTRVSGLTTRSLRSSENWKVGYYLIAFDIRQNALSGSKRFLHVCLLINLSYRKFSFILLITIEIRGYDMTRSLTKITQFLSLLFERQWFKYFTIYFCFTRSNVEVTSPLKNTKFFVFYFSFVSAKMEWKHSIF